MVDQVAKFLTPAYQKGSRLQLRGRLDAYAARLASRIDRGLSPACGFMDGETADR
ncbi:hypothetical protein ACFRAA_34365 [[Kitasatospora] papulosa]|uniref:hypothetical protein n=1 Tax=[Kitasatospora] papulosa TaxID=1464011 RepID=UPI00363AB312